jgi:hypothetical protein
MYEKLKEQIAAAKVDLEVVRVLSEGMKQNPAFSRTLDGQVDTIIQRANSVHKSFSEFSLDLDKMATELQADAEAKVPRDDASILFTGGKPVGEASIAEGPDAFGKMKKAAEANVGVGDGAELDPTTKELLEKFKDKK